MTFATNGKEAARPRRPQRERRIRQPLKLAGALLAIAAAASATPAERMTTLRMQMLLDRAGFSPGEIDGAPGSNTKRALEAYSRARGLGTEAVLTSLSADTAPTLVAYTLTEEDLAAASGKQIPEDMMEKAKLDSLGYSSVIEAVGEKFHASPHLLRRLNPNATWSTPGETLEVPNIRNDPPAGKPARVVVDESDASVTVLRADNGVYARYPATMGSRLDPLPVGEWKIKGVSRDPPFFYNPDLFWDADETHAKVKIAPGPNNPVGVVWIDLSKEHYGIHGTPEPSTVGKTQSHGCIRLTNWDASELAGLVSLGLPAILKK